MSDKKFVQSIMPTAVGDVLENTPFGVGPRYNPSEPMYVVYATDAENRPYIVGFSMISQDKVWNQVAETFRQKMLSQLEAS